MVMPLYDNTPLRFLRRPVVNWALIGVNVAIFVLVQSEVFGDPLTIMRGFAVIPRVLFGEAALAKWIVGPPAPLTLLTSLFFHSGFLHILGNMLFLYVFGDNIEDAMGSLHYLLFYLSCGVASGVVFAYASPHTVTPLVGASGAISGVCAAFLLLHPRSTIFGTRGRNFSDPRPSLDVRRHMDIASIPQRHVRRTGPCRLVRACWRHSRGAGADAPVQAAQRAAFRRGSSTPAASAPALHAGKRGCAAEGMTLLGV